MAESDWSYWIERQAAVRDGGMLTNADACALFDYLEDLKMAARWTINEPTALHRWFDLKTVLDNGPKEPTP